jgi:acyl-coenzyme A synthetase/AMP-(fatty) acid ligase
MSPSSRLANKPWSGRYDEHYASFRWRIPETFNYGADVIDYWAREHDGLALIWENVDGTERRISYTQLSNLSNQFGNVLYKHGVAKGDRVLIMMPRIPEWAIAMIAVLKVGAIPVPCIEMLTARDLEYRVRHSGAKAIVCRAAQVEKLASVLNEVPVRIALGDQPGWLEMIGEMAEVNSDFSPAVMSAEDPAIMYYTSGSTGHPKAVLHAARALFAWRMSALYWLDLSVGDVIWCTADTGWSKAGTSIVFGPMSCGACSLIYDGPFVSAERLRLLAKHQVNVYCAAGTELSRVVDEDFSKHDLTALRRTVSAGESVNPIIAERWEKKTGVRVDEAYGQTETLMLVLNYSCEPVKYGSMGRPSPGCDVDVIDRAGQRLAPGQEGDLALRMPNPQMMLAYWKDEERTRGSYLDASTGRWYVTGDRAVRDEDGYLWYRGRSDDLINSAGYRIGPLEVENALLEHPSVQSCAVIGSFDEVRGEIVKAFIVLREGRAPSAELTRELQDHVKSITAPYKYPRAIEYVDELPTTITGKINRKALRDLDRSRQMLSK